MTAGQFEVFEVFLFVFVVDIENRRTVTCWRVWDRKALSRNRKGDDTHFLMVHASESRSVPFHSCGRAFFFLLCGHFCVFSGAGLLHWRSWDSLGKLGPALRRAWATLCALGWSFMPVLRKQGKELCTRGDNV